jgi:tetratricopeptide (TPR) repeat protein
MEDATRLICRAARGAGLAAAVVLVAAGGAWAESGSAVAAPDSAQVLAGLAREAAGRDDHAAAIEHARRAMAMDARLRDEMSLLTAHQLTWADRPAEAIPWYRECLVRDDGNQEARLGLARALSWTGDLEGARAEYLDALARDPDDEEAMVGLARVDAWSERWGAAARGFRDALERYPDSGEARRGLANAQNNRGLHRDAERIYLEQLDADPGDTEAREGLARARWWMGEEDAAVATLGVGEGAGAGAGAGGGGLAAAIRDDHRTITDLSGSRWTDADDQELWIFGLSAEKGLGDGRRARAAVTHLRTEEPGVPRIDATRGDLGGDWRLSRAFAVHAGVGAIDVGRNLDARDSVDVGEGIVLSGDDVASAYLLWDAWVTWNPADRTRIDLSHSRVPLDSPRSLARGIRADVLSLGADRTFTDLVSASAAGRWARYTDGNERLSVDGEVEVGPFRAVRLSTWVSAGASAFTFDDSPDRGYYSPERYDALWVGGRAELRIAARAALEADARLSTEHEDEGDRFGVLNGGGLLRVPLEGGYAFSVFARKSTSRFDTGGGYEREGVGLSLIRAW